MAEALGLEPRWCEFKSHPKYRKNKYKEERI